MINEYYIKDSIKTLYKYLSGEYDLKCYIYSREQCQVLCHANKCSSVMLKRKISVKLNINVQCLYNLSF